jgi:hypothetical protein
MVSPEELLKQLERDAGDAALAFMIHLQLLADALLNEDETIDDTDVLRAIERGVNETPETEGRLEIDGIYFSIEARIGRLRLEMLDEYGLFRKNAEPQKKLAPTPEAIKAFLVKFIQKCLAIPGLLRLSLDSDEMSQAVFTLKALIVDLTYSSADKHGNRQALIELSLLDPVTLTTNHDVLEALFNETYQQFRLDEAERNKPEKQLVEVLVATEDHIINLFSRRQDHPHVLDIVAQTRKILDQALKLIPQDKQSFHTLLAGFAQILSIHVPLDYLPGMAKLTLEGEYIIVYTPTKDGVEPPLQLDQEVADRAITSLLGT